jgi:putative two-component system response regulator
MSEIKKYVIICCDLPHTMDQLKRSLEKDYQLFCMNHADLIVNTAVQKKPDIIIISINRNKADGIAACAQLTKNKITTDIPVLFVSEIFDESDTLKAFKAGAADYMKYAHHAQELRARMDNYIQLRQSRERLVQKHEQLNDAMLLENERLQNLMIATIRAIVQTVESRDPYTAGHQQRVSDLATEIAMRMGLDSEQKMAIKYSGLLHDIGKLRVPEAILNRPGKLLSMEFDVLKIHPEIGSSILESIQSPWPLARIVLEHHERLDGSGYPNGLTENEILLESRVLAVADVMEAMSSHRPYRPSQGIDLALKEINSQKGVLYDKRAVDVCTELFTRHQYKFGW